MEAPIYTEFYIEVEKDGIPVHFPDFEEGGGYDSFLHKSSLEELVAYKTEHGNDPPIYVRVEHKLEYPYAKWDCVDTIVDDLFTEFMGTPREPHRYCRAAIVATPSMALI